MNYRENTNSINVGGVKIGGQNKVVIQSMTIEERRHPEILKASRKIRIAKGCAMEVSDVNYVLKKYEQMFVKRLQFGKIRDII